MVGLRGNIVLVEDDSGMNQAVSRLLRTSGFNVDSFDSAGALLASNALGGAHCVVLDVHLPDMSGFDLQRHLAACGRIPPLILITGHDDLHNRQRAHQIGAAAYLAKPFSGLTLLGEIERVLRPGERPQPDPANPPPA